MSQEKFWILFSKKLSQEATAEELTELQELIREHPEWQYAIQNIEDLWSLRPVNPVSESEEAYALHMQRMKGQGFFQESGEADLPIIPAAKKPGYGWYLVAASVIGILVMGFLVFGKKKSTELSADTGIVSNTAASVNEISTEPGSRSKVQLPDGSVVWLNTGSKLVYDKSFGQDIREVELKGEAFFDVAKDKERPFIIHTRSIDIKVLGTAFNVKAYPEDKTTETSLIRGSVEVSVKKRPNEKIILSPNEKLVVKNTGDNEIVITGKKEPVKPEIYINQLVIDPKDSSIAETQWVENRLVFRDEPFSEIAARLERWYNVKIVIEAKDLEELRLSGTFDDETVEQALQGLAYTKDFHYDIRGKTIFIHK